MKKTFLFPGFFTVVTFFMIACNGGSDNPKYVAKHFFEALKTMNIDEAEKYATKDSKTVLDLMKTFVSMAPENKDSIKAQIGKQKIEYSEPVVNGNEATISITVDDKEKTDFKLKKEDGAWKVAFDKNTLMKTGMEKMEQHGASDEDLKKAEDAINQLATDSISQKLNGVGKELEEAGKKLDSLNK